MKLYYYKNIINKLEHYNKLLKNYYKFNKYPVTGIVYVIKDYNINKNIIYYIYG